MMESATSAGVLLYRRQPMCVLLVHPGGPFWRNKDVGAWQIPKGLIEPGEAPAAAARREAGEELGIVLDGVLLALGEPRQAGGKRVHGYALEQEFDPARLRSNMVTLEWPAHSGRMRSFPEVDAAQWMGFEEARGKMLPSQLPFLDMLETRLRK